MSERKILVIGMAGLGIHAQAQIAREASLRNLSIVKLEEVEKDLKEIRNDFDKKEVFNIKPLEITDEYNRISFNQGISGKEMRRQTREKERKQSKQIIKQKYVGSRKYRKK